MAREQQQRVKTITRTYPDLDCVGDKGAGRQTIGDLCGRGDKESDMGLVQQGADGAAGRSWSSAGDGCEGRVRLLRRRGVGPVLVLAVAVAVAVAVFRV